MLLPEPENIHVELLRFKQMKKICGFFWSLILSIATKILNIIYGIIHKELTDEIFEGWVQFIKFGMIGALNTVLNYIITEVGYYLLKEKVGDNSLALQISQTIGFIITVFISFLLNNSFVFRKEEGQQRNPLITLIKTYIAYSFTGVFLNNVLVYIEINMIHMSALIAPVINLVVDVPINFFMNKLWAYKVK